MEKYLNTFQNDEYVREAVKDFLTSQLNKLALERVYERKNTNDVADAKEIIEKAFVELHELYGKKKPVELQSIR